jgi:hypothetical protein
MEYPQKILLLWNIRRRFFDISRSYTDIDSEIYSILKIHRKFWTYLEHLRRFWELYGKPAEDSGMYPENPQNTPGRIRKIYRRFWDIFGISAEDSGTSLENPQKILGRIRKIHRRFWGISGISAEDSLGPMWKIRR